MRIERIVYDAEADALVEARLSSDVFLGARVPLDDVGREEGAWLASLAARALRALFGEDALEGAYVLHEDADGAYRVDRGGAEVLVVTRTAAPHDEVARYLLLFAEATSGALLLDENTRGVRREASESAPA